MSFYQAIQLGANSLKPLIKNAESKERFFRGVWLALAYGKIRVNADGNFCLRQRSTAIFQNYKRQSRNHLII